MSDWQAALGPPAPLAVGLLVALGGGLLVGLERERRKGHGPGREAAGLRSFTLVSVAGALAHGLAVPGLLPAGALVVGGLAALAYWRQSPGDPGLTTEIALLLTFLIGALSLQAPALGAAAAVVMTMLLAARSRLHHFATRVLNEQELHDGLLLAALALIVLPLMPDEPIAWLAGLKARTLLGLVTLLLLLQAAGHVALRALGARLGLTLTGLFSGLVSSTATIAAMGGRARAQPELRRAFAAAAVMSTAATWLQAAVLLGSLAPGLLRVVAPVCMAGMLCALGLALMLARGAPSVASGPGSGGPLRLREALLVATLLSAVSALVGWANGHFGEQGLLASVALAAFADAHAPMASLGSLAAQGRIAPQLLTQALLLTIACNTLTRCVTACVAGGWPYARWVIGALLLSWTAAATMGFGILAALR
ncbi:MgtC/SapB family protein [Roseateles sp. DAIF2]|uniref:MgtC/SapB family protein n=1 Tax=Roseateles sp. DAIF2 TaxID=2714952 RepID=UPI0018A272E0|nr:DUF4010 domain-containing protein [Roseateles sp. DAIF2]QPF74402.1 MgtC/SapB family protein [Roseateles sp. DAIF2]